MAARPDTRQFVQHTFREGDIILRENDPGDCAYIIQSGEVEIFRGWGGARNVLAVIGPGGIFGEMALIDNKPRMASAMALRATICLVVPVEVFHDRLEKSDPFIRALLRILVNNIRSLTH
ncbi:Cyclic nucleotide-binding domain-containing protein [Azospirillaceae bacterium]